MGYEVHLKQFSGPLDLLLHLIQKAEVDIKDIFISEITAEYLALMDGIGALDMDTASEFLSVAATLLYIKSRSLLPRPPRDEAQLEEDPEEALLRQLCEYKGFKEAGAMLERLCCGMDGCYTKLPEEFAAAPPQIEWINTSVDSLMTALREALKRGVGPEPVYSALHRVRADRFTVRAQLKRIRDVLMDRGRVDFSELFGQDASKIEIIVTFMALLDMIMRNEIKLHQNQPYAPITIEAHRLEDNDEGEQFMDEV